MQECFPKQSGSITVDVVNQMMLNVTNTLEQEQTVSVSVDYKATCHKIVLFCFVQLNVTKAADRLWGQSLINEKKHTNLSGEGS